MLACMLRGLPCGSAPGLCVPLAMPTPGTLFELPSRCICGVALLLGGRWVMPFIPGTWPAMAAYCSDGLTGVMLGLA